MDPTKDRKKPIPNYLNFCRFGTHPSMESSYRYCKERRSPDMSASSTWCIFARILDHHYFAFIPCISLVGLQSISNGSGSIWDSDTDNGVVPQIGAVVTLWTLSDGQQSLGTDSWRILNLIWEYTDTSPSVGASEFYLPSWELSDSALEISHQIERSSPPIPKTKLESYDKCLRRWRKVCQALFCLIR